MQVSTLSISFKQTYDLIIQFETLRENEKKTVSVMTTCERSVEVKLRNNKSVLVEFPLMNNWHLWKQQNRVERKKKK